MPPVVENSENIGVDLESKPLSGATVAQQMAHSFLNMSSEDMVAFFNEISATPKHKTNLAMKLQEVTDSPELTDPSRQLMGLIGEYSE